MKTFEVIVSETSIYTMQIEAENEDQALDIALWRIEENWAYVESCWTDSSYEVDIV